MVSTRRPLREIREMTIEAMRDYKEHTRQEIVEIIEQTNQIKLAIQEKNCVSYVLRSYPGIMKSVRGPQDLTFKLSRAQQQNIELKTRFQNASNELSDLQVQLENIKLDQEIRETYKEVAKVKREITKARQSLS